MTTPSERPGILQSGLLPVPGGHNIYWETAGNPGGKPALVLHGGPGSGCRPGHLDLFDLTTYHVVLLDQRGCGRSRPLASETLEALQHNTTSDLLADIELLRCHLGLERWLVFGGSWGTSLALLYAQAHPERVSELVLAAVSTVTPSELNWLYGDVGNLFPEAHDAFRDGAPKATTTFERVETYAELLRNPDPQVRQKAADDWCRWELALFNETFETTLVPGWADPAFRLGFARIVTHYFRNLAWLKPDQITRNMQAIANIPGVMIHSRFDPSIPLRIPWELSKHWPAARLNILSGGDHSALSPDMTSHIRAATDRFRTSAD